MSQSRRRILFASPWWHSDLVDAVAHHSAKHGWRIDLDTCISGRLPDRWDGDGYITQLSYEPKHQRRFMANTRCPGVSLNPNFPEIDIPVVSADLAIAGRLAAEHLIDRGFRSFAFYSRELSPAGRPRYEAFAKRLAKDGYSVDPLSWSDERGDRPDEPAERQAWLRQRLAALDKPSGLFAFNDQQAAEVIDACLDQSIAVPDEVAVLGLLDMGVFRHSTSVALSSIALDSDETARIACDLLARLMDGEAPPAEPILLPPIGLVVRESTDTLAAHAPVVARAVRYMFDHYAEPITIDELLEAVGGSRGGLFKAFRNDMDRTPFEALMHIRVDKAKRLLAVSDDKVYAIADACGFNKPANLHRAFQRHVGQSPNDYRRSVRRSPNAADQADRWLG